jgi:hypothetical protein
MACSGIWATPSPSPGTIVKNCKLDPSVPVVHLDARIGGARMSNDVSQGLACDAVHRRTGLAGHRLDVVRQLQLHGEAGRAYRLDQLG